jgi:hypothetical protein
MKHEWKTEYNCFYCKESLSNDDRCYGGRCPYCGNKHPDACSFVKTTERAYYDVRIGKWYEFWKYKRVYK